MAGEVVLYQPPPAWVDVADVAAAARKAGAQPVVFDEQERVEGATVTTYVDTALRIDNPQALTQLGTFGAVWMPDKGNLVIHRAEILRGGEVIDLLKGEKFQVLRREEQLEQRQLNGMLTATLPVSGARVGDIVRLSYSVSRADAALGGQVQSLRPLVAGDIQPGFARVRMSWPQARAIRVSAGPRTTLPAPVRVGGYETLTIALPLAKPAEMPHDAPPRYRAAPRIEMTSFTNWEEVSRTMAPLFDTGGTITPGDPIAAEVDKIKAANSTTPTRMAAALQLVQDRISYFLNGMNGGNYVPQSPAKTWALRYGDCKAKALLLAAMLREMGISADVVMVASKGGDGLPESLPMPAAFDHVIVHATADGHDYWLDGTSAGSRLASLEDVPPFRFALPLKPAGSGLIELPAKAPARPSMKITERLDESAGIDFPALVTVRIDITGPMLATMEQFAAQPAGENRDAAIDRALTAVVGGGAFLDRAIAIDEPSGVATVTATGLLATPWDRSGKRAVYEPSLMSGKLGFQPDRGRTAWQGIPVWLGEPMRMSTSLSVDLPDAGAGTTLDGGSFHGTVAQVKVDREAKLDGPRLSITDEVASSGGEIPVSGISAARAEAAALANLGLRVRASPSAKRAWDVRTPADRRRLQSIEDFFARKIAEKPDESWRYLNRAGFLVSIGDFAAAQRDYDKAVSLDGSADALAARAENYEQTGNLDRAIADLRQAQQLGPSPERLSALARLIGRNGHPADGLALVEPELDHVSGDGRVILTAARSDLLAELDRKQEGAAALGDLLAERPSDATVLNALCWYRGIWNYGLDQAGAQCNQALEASSWAPNVLDSRAFVNLRLGKLEAALSDANAALGLAPAQVQTLLLRGVIRKRQGDAGGGAADIAEALRRDPSLAREYRLYGVLP
jgi:tetratricopeptide (TPR) repeat protein